MKKRSALALLLAMMLVLLAGCGEQDPEKLAAKVVAEVNGEQITRGEAQKVYDFLADQTVMYYASQMGMEVDPEDKDFVSSTKSTVLAIMTETLAMEQKLTELGQPLTEEDKASIKEMAAEEYGQMVQNYVASYGMTEEEAKAQVDSIGYSEYAFEYMIYVDEIESRLLSIVSQDIEVTEDDILTRYAIQVAEAEAGYKENPDQFVNDVMSGNTLYARPYDFRYIKNIVIGFPEDIDAQITEKDTENYNLLIEQYTANSELESNAELTDEEKAELEEKVASYEPESARIQSEIEALEAEAFEQITPDAEAVLEKAQERGADFDALMAEYSKDTPTGDILTYGYPVGEGISSYVSSFTEGAMALEKLGDVSGLIKSEYGYHILQYAGDVPGGPVDLEEVRDAVIALLKSEKEEEALTAKKTEWLNEAKIKNYISRF